MRWQEQHALAGKDGLIDRVNAIAATPAPNVHSHSYDSAAVSNRSGRYPLLVFSPGLGLNVGEYAAQLEELASDGYVVAGVNPTYSTDVVLSSGRLVRAVFAASDRADISKLVALWAEDLRFVMDQMTGLNRRAGDRFEGRLQTASIGLLGHCAGGAAAAMACSEDARCAGAVDNGR